MNSFILFKDSFFRFSTLKEAKNMPFWKVILYVFFLSVILTFPSTKQIFEILGEIKHDGQQVTEKLPEFSITNGKLQTAKNAEGFIYQTDSIIFTFDPEGKRSIKDIVSDSIGDAVSIAFLKDSFVIALPNSSVADALLGSNQFEVPYSKGSLDGLNSQDIKDSLASASIPLWIKLIVFAVALYLVFINFLINLLLIAIGASLYSKIKRYKLRFFDCLKISIYCTTFPVLLISLLHFVNPGFNDSTIMIFVSLIIFFLAVRNEEQIQLPTS